MTLPPNVSSSSLITPLEPCEPRWPREAARAVTAARQSTHSTAFRRIEAAVASACGSQHESNEDAHSALDASSAVFVVADGVGGGAMAQMASRQLVAQLHAALDVAALDADLVRRAMLDADRAIARRIASVTDAPGAATVALCAPVNLLASKWLIAWVGDCRVYRLSARAPRAFELLTRDDTFRHLDELPPGGGALDDPARMVGNGAITGANLAFHDLASGDLLVLCSDGVHKHLDTDAWSSLLTQRVPLAQRCEDLIGRARANGSVDDATVLLVQRGAFSLPRPRWVTHLTGTGTSADGTGGAQ
ncbi:MAG: protein phosphatase 2C domain-containing protein [Pseudomonadota bacterium]